MNKIVTGEQLYGVFVKNVVDKENGGIPMPGYEGLKSSKKNHYKGWEELANFVNKKIENE